MKINIFIKKIGYYPAIVTFGIFLLTALSPVTHAQTSDGMPPSILAKRATALESKTKTKDKSKSKVVTRRNKVSNSRRKVYKSPKLPPHVIVINGEYYPEPGYDWADEDSLDVVLMEGLIDDGDGNFSLEPGYKWATDDPNDFTAVLEEIKINQIAYQQNILRNGQSGMLITTNFTINNLSDTACKIWAEFKFRSGKKLTASSNNYKTDLGQLATRANFTPSSDSQSYLNVEIFIPYTEFRLPDKNLHLLSFDLKISDADEELIVSCEDNEFELCINCK